MFYVHFHTKHAGGSESRELNDATSFELSVARELGAGLIVIRPTKVNESEPAIEVFRQGDSSPVAVIPFPKPPK